VDRASMRAVIRQLPTADRADIGCSEADNQAFTRQSCEHSCRSCRRRSVLNAGPPARADGAHAFHDRRVIIAFHVFGPKLVRG